MSRFAMRSQVRQAQPLASLMMGIDGGVNHYNYIEQIRSSGRASPTRLSGIVTADLTLVRDILRDNRFVTIAPGNLPFPAPMRWILRKTDTSLPNPIEPPALLAVDPPHHARFRKLVSYAFTPKATELLKATIEDTTDELLVKLGTREDADLISEYAALLPVSIIAELLGMPRSDAPMLLKWGNEIATLLDIGMPWKPYRRASVALIEMDEYFDSHLAVLRTALEGESDFDGVLVHIIQNGDLTARELKATMALLLNAGFDTTVNLIGNGLVALLRNPDQLSFLRDNPDAWPNAVEEILRYDSPVQITARIATSRVEVDSQSLDTGHVAMLLLGGANRDPTVFDKPSQFDIFRPNAREHVAFSSGIHACVGASLARTEAVVAFRSLFERFPDISLNGEPVPAKHVNLRGYESVKVKLGRRHPC